MDKEMIDCMTEAGLDTIEIQLRRRMEDLLSEGRIEAAEDVEETIKHLDDVPLCETEADTFDKIRARHKFIGIR